MNYITAQEANKIALENLNYTNDDYIKSILQSIKTVASKGKFCLFGIKLDIDQEIYLRTLGYRVREVFPYNKCFEISWNKVKGAK